MEIFSCPLHFNRWKLLLSTPVCVFHWENVKYQCLNFDSLVLEPKKSFLKTILGTIHYLCQGSDWQEWGVGHVKFRTVRRGGGVINKSAHKEGGGYVYIPDFLFLFYFQAKLMLSVLLGLTVHGLQAS